MTATSRVWATGILVGTAVYLAPLGAAPERIAHPGPWLGFVAALVTFLSQPPLGPQELMRDRGDRLSALGILAGGMLAQLVAMVDFVLRDPPGPAPLSMQTGAGTLVVAGSLALRLWSIRTLGRFFTSAVHVVADQPVVDAGPYRLVRHPSYVGALGTQLGVCIALGSLWGIAAVLALAGPAYAYRVHIEERALGDRLGHVYACYSARTWRFVPYVY